MIAPVKQTNCYEIYYQNSKANDWHYWSTEMSYEVAMAVVNNLIDIKMTTKIKIQKIMYT